MTWSEDRTARVWDARGKQRASLVHDASVDCADMSRDARFVFTAAGDVAAVWTARGRREAQWRLPEPVRIASWSPRGDRIVTLPPDGCPRLWTPDGRPAGVLEGHTQRVCSVTFSEDGTALLTSSADRTARLWSADGTERRALPHADEVYGARFLPAGRGIVTIDKEGRACHWDPEGEPVAVLHGHEDPCTWVACDAEGERILTVSDDQTGRLWPITREGLLRAADRSLHRDFTPEERSKLPK